MNNIQVHRLTGEYLGLLPWGFKTEIPTMNVMHEFYKYPVAAFHGIVDINFKRGHSWSSTELQWLLELHTLWVLNQAKTEKLQ